MGRTIWAAASGIALAVAVAVTAAETKPDVPVDPVAVEVRATPIAAFDPRDPERRRFGALEFRGGLELTSAHPAFGGLSALHLDPKGERVLALSDVGLWVTGRFGYDRGRLARFEDVRIGAARGTAGEPLGRIGRGDTESLAVVGTTCFVGIERRNELRRFDCAGPPFLSRGTPLPVPAAVRRLQHNKGLEALVAVPGGAPLAGALIGFGERGESEGADNPGIFLRGPVTGEFRVRRSNDFDVTDAAVLGDSLLVLERHFSLLRGVAVRLRRVPLAAIAPGAVVEGEVLLVADNTHQVDNMEALAVHVNGAGETILTMISDDNFSMLQRTIVLQFKLLD